MSSSHSLPWSCKSQSNQAAGDFPGLLTCRRSQAWKVFLVFNSSPAQLQTSTGAHSFNKFHFSGREAITTIKSLEATWPGLSLATSGFPNREERTTLHKQMTHNFISPLKCTTFFSYWTQVLAVKFPSRSQLGQQMFSQCVILLASCGWDCQFIQVPEYKQALAQWSNCSPHYKLRETIFQASLGFVLQES